MAPSTMYDGLSHRQWDLGPSRAPDSYAASALPDNICTDRAKPFGAPQTSCATRLSVTREALHQSAPVTGTWGFADRPLCLKRLQELSVDIVAERIFEEMSAAGTAHALPLNFRSVPEVR